MELAEIYTKLASHMIKGVMFHTQMADYYDFLCLQGYRTCHEYHMYEEMSAYRSLCHYVVNHHDMLIPDERIESPNAIPASWYKHVRQDADVSTKKDAVKEGLVAWVNWETKTKKLYEQMYIELMNLGAVADACEIKKLVMDVDDELQKAKEYQLNKEAIGYDMSEIIAEQDCKKEKYEIKMKEKIELC